MKKLILVHGMNATKESWNTVPKILSQSLNVETEAIDLAGHNKGVPLFKIVLSRTSGQYKSGLTMNDYIGSVAR